jgi:predicted RNase H-like HicB family nuclease
MTTLVFVAFAEGDLAAGYTASFPDLPGAQAQGGDLPALLASAREALLKALQDLTDEGLDWPSATPIEAVSATPGSTPILVDVTVEDTPLRVNISIGERLLKRIDQAAEARGMSRSGFIATACRGALGDRPGWSGGEFDAVARKLQDEWSVLGRKLTESLGPDSAFSRNMAEFDGKVSDTIRRTADNISAAMARRRESEGAAPAADPGTGPETATSA